MSQILTEATFCASRPSGLWPQCRRGGTGGVHRGIGQVLDVSQDLPVIGRSRCLTVCAAAKSILDLPNTLEYLETMSVLVLGYQTDTLFARQEGGREKAGGEASGHG